MNPETPPAANREPACWQAVLLTSLAGGMGWGIRGQYGHETGAMIAGALVGTTLLLLFGKGADPLRAMRAAAFATIAMGIGGSMTYGQTIGLTQDRDLIGNWAAWRWGMLGLGIKGAAWIGFAGLFLGMGLGGVRYSWRAIAGLMLGMGALYLGGVWLLNSPHDPAQRLLPRIYFSASWDWRPAAGPELRPRPEVWGGLWCALLGAWLWAGVIRRDVLARRLARWGMLGGLGFPLGQTLQSWHAWQPEVFRGGWWDALAPHVNWWNAMETSFGAAMGACLGAGVWLNRSLLQLRAETAPAVDTLPAPIEWLLAAGHVALLVLAEFSSVRWANTLYDPGLVLAAMPLIAVAGGRWWPWLLVLPVTLVPIAGKTIRRLVYQAPAIGEVAGWFWYGVLPLALVGATAWWLAQRRDRDGREIMRGALLVNAWTYFGLNFGFFAFPWPWEKWTTRTPSALVFAVCLAGLTLAALRLGRGRAAS